MIIAGAVLFYLTVILFGIDENVLSYSKVDKLCQARIWLVAACCMVQSLLKLGEYITFSIMRSPTQNS